MKENIILFDLDGTLINSTEAIVSTFRHAFDKMHYDFTGSDQEIMNLIGYPLDIMFLELGVENDHVWSFVDAYKQRYRTISVEQTFLLEKAIESLELASSFARLSIVTTKTGKYTIPILEHLKIAHFFEFVTGRENVDHPKPHPEPILKTLDLMNIEKTSNIWMIGDTHLDLISANSAGVNSVAVLCGYGEKESLKEYTSHIAEDSLAAVQLIQEYKV